MEEAIAFVIERVAPCLDLGNQVTLICNSYKFNYASDENNYNWNLKVQIKRSEDLAKVIF